MAGGCRLLAVISRQNGFLPLVLLMLQRRRGSYCFRRVSCSWFLLRGLWMLFVVVLGRRGCSFPSSCTLYQTAHILLRFGVWLFLFAMLIAHSRSFCLCWTAVLICGYSFWHIKMSSSVFASISRFAFKFLFVCLCRAVGVGLPHPTCFRIHLSSQKQSSWFFSPASLFPLPRTGYVSYCRHEGVFPSSF